MKDIYILHEYETKSHFEALYQEAKNYNYNIKEYIIISKKQILKKFIKKVINEKEVLRSLGELIKDIKNYYMSFNLKNKIIIIGVAPYDKLLNKYETVIANNKSIYFTSWEYWDGTLFPKATIKNKLYFEKILSEKISGIACVSKKTQDGIKELNCNNIVVNHSINTQSYNKSSKKNKITRFIFLGLFIDRKNLDIIKKWILLNKDAEYEFYFAGSGPEEYKIKELEKESENIIYLGRLTKDEIKTSLCEYDFMVLPSKKEPFGIVIIESLAAGVPVVASNVVGPSEIIDDEEDGFLFESEDYMSFDLCMNKCLNLSNDIYEKMSHKAVEKSKKYDTKQIIMKWVDLIER